MGSVEDYARSLHVRADAVSAQDFSNIKFYVQHAAAAYCNYNATAGTDVLCDKNACPLVEQNKVTIVGSVAGDVTGIGIYVGLDQVRQEIVLSARGSDSIRNFVTDIIFFWHVCHFGSNCKVHAGFSKAWREVRDEVVGIINSARGAYPNYRVVVTGHSLGAAVAVLAAADLRKDGITVDIYTYGSPRVGNDHFSDWMDAQPGGHWRVTHGKDPIPKLPPLAFGYRHMSPEYWLSDGGYEADYPIGMVKVCEGIASTSCNAGTSGINVGEHLHYLGDTSACFGNPLRWKRAGFFSPELEQRLRDWSRQDQEFVKNSKSKSLMQSTRT
ncbi:hypothetical protein E4U41_005865 [Claviceps citrina]|nr:hypothetical protein E4U41_005865 [Claviceps citrina]